MYFSAITIILRFVTNDLHYFRTRMKLQNGLKSDHKIYLLRPTLKKKALRMNLKIILHHHFLILAQRVNPMKTINQIRMMAHSIMI